MGKKVKKYLQNLINSYEKNLFIYTIKDKRGKYGRYLGEL